MSCLLLLPDPPFVLLDLYVTLISNYKSNSFILPRMISICYYVSMCVVVAWSISRCHDGFSPVYYTGPRAWGDGGVYVGAEVQGGCVHKYRRRERKPIYITCQVWGPYSVCKIDRNSTSCFSRHFSYSPSQICLVWLTPPHPSTSPLGEAAYIYLVKTLDKHDITRNARKELS
jgi:hypothetical protein